MDESVLDEICQVIVEHGEMAKRLDALEKEVAFLRNKQQPQECHYAPVKFKIDDSLYCKKCQQLKSICMCTA